MTFRPYVIAFWKIPLDFEFFNEPSGLPFHGIGTSFSPFFENSRKGLIVKRQGEMPCLLFPNKTSRT
jgi:hypothetical protein